MSKEYFVKKVLNTNCLLLSNHQNEKIVMGKGIGFQFKAYQSVESTAEFEREFTQVNSQEFKSDQSLVSVAGMMEIFQKELKSPISKKTAEALFGHLSAVIKRIENQEVFENPFHYETKALYLESYDTAKLIAHNIQKELEITIPDAEVDFLTMYVHTILHIKGGTSVKQLNKIVYRIREYLEEEWGLHPDKESLNYARFITHIKFVIMRLTRQEKTPEFAILGTIFDCYKEYIPIAQGIAKILQDNLQVLVGEDELAYIIVHLVRLKLLEGTHAK